MPTLVIDNQEIQVPADTKVVEAAERLGIVIPRFCYHPALGSVGACRVCAVAFKEGPVKGIQMSCMVEAQDGMVVSTTDDEAVDFRRHVIEWLMLHHPHDCPVCDEGGHCLLQDTTIAGGHGLRRYEGKKRTHVDQYLGPLVQHEMNRCIQCYRCARYYQEFTGYRDLGVMGIGSRIYFGRSTPGRLESPFSGNLIDICPTGVYTDKPSRFFGRRWDFERSSSICIHCSLGCNLVVSARYRQVVRQEARFNAEVNGHFICDRGRFGFSYANLEKRPRLALAKGQPVTMGEALGDAAEKLLSITKRLGPESIAIIGSMRSSLDTMAAMKQSCRENQWIGPMATMTQRHADNLAAALSRMIPDTAISLSDISAADAIVVIGCDPLNEAPMLALSLRQAHLRGGHVVVIDPRGVELPLDFDHWGTHPADLGAIIKKVDHALRSGEKTTLDENEMSRLSKLIQQLLWSKRAVVICGTDITTPHEISLAADLVKTLSQADVNASLFYTLTGANAPAAYLLNGGTNYMTKVIEGIEAGQVSAIVAVESDVWQNFPDQPRLKAALDKLELLIALDCLESPLNDLAHYFIPTQTIYESGGTWINQEGRFQTASPAYQGGEPILFTGIREHPPRVFENQTPGAQPLPAWQGLIGLTQTTGESHNQWLAKAINDFHPAISILDTGDKPDHIDLAAIRDDQFGLGVDDSQKVEQIVASDNLILLLVDQTFGTERLSTQNQALIDMEPAPGARMHPQTINRLGLNGSDSVAISHNASELILPLMADEKVAHNVIVVPRHFQLGWQIFQDTRVTLDKRAIKPMIRTTKKATKVRG